MLSSFKHVDWWVAEDPSLESFWNQWIEIDFKVYEAKKLYRPMGFTSDSLKVGEPYPYYYSARGSPFLDPIQIGWIMRDWCFDLFIFIFLSCLTYSPITILLVGSGSPGSKVGFQFWSKNSVFQAACKVFLVLISALAALAFCLKEQQQTKKLRAREGFCHIYCYI